jgi:nitrite reductase/ring-hydroxylating ferredoxin subunit
MLAVVKDLCGHLADRIKANGAKRPKITYAWHNAAFDLLTGDDPYTPEQVWDVIEWAQADPFWAGCTTTMASMARNFDQIVIRAKMQSKNPATPQGKQAEQEILRRRLEKKDQFMAAFQVKYGRKMTDAERKQLVDRLKEEIQ